jgi:hypothetical protein
MYVQLNALDFVCKYLKQFGICQPAKFCLILPSFEVKNMGSSF